MGPEANDMAGNSGNLGVRERVTGIYSRLVLLARELPDQMSSGEYTDMKGVKRLIQHITDMISDGDPLLLGMALGESRYDYSYRHPVNVCILSVALGHKIGLGKKELADLGLAAFLSDIGKLLVPPEVLHKKGAYDENDWRIMRRHTVQGFKVVFGIPHADEQLIRASIVSFEHHLHCDLSGYPAVCHIPEQDFYTRVVVIAEWYDALTAAKSYKEGYRSPDTAIKIMLKKTGKELDPVLVKVFVSMMGIYPVGSFVMLDSNELGIVVEPHTVLLTRPRVLVISDNQGHPVTPFIAALSRRDETRKYLRTITKTLCPNDYKIDYASFFYRKLQHPGIP
jgi:HD-GYP domain-containing protein (c-di-GMP phosphodiesterase class II)